MMSKVCFSNEIMRYNMTFTDLKIYWFLIKYPNDEKPCLNGLYNNILMYLDNQIYIKNFFDCLYLKIIDLAI